MECTMSQDRARSRTPRRQTEIQSGKIKNVVVVGGGVIGSGWAARFKLNGIDVTVVDPDPEAERKISAVISNAERAFDKLTMAPMPVAGKVVVHNGTLESACASADFIVEALPEVLTLKKSVLSRIDKSAQPEVIIASSTSGLLPTQMQADLTHPERLVVTHPFNPVYLLPLVEVVGGDQTSAAVKKDVANILESIGMHPLVLGVEIDGFVADRLLEAVWREALHLVNDGVATTKQIDEAICYGPGLRWSFMGTFLTYRLAGGEGGMRHFLSQFGPALKLPWTKLVAPELTEKLIEQVVSQLDDQIDPAAVPHLAHRRDDCLVAVMQALREQDCSAGSVLKKYEEKLLSDASRSSEKNHEDDITKPLRLVNTRVKAEWIDYNGHMTESRYLQVFGDGTDALLRYIGVDAEYLAKGLSYYTVETHIMHKKEVAGGEPLTVCTQLLSVDEKRIQLFHTMEHGKSGTVLATAEQMLLHVNTKKSCACPADPAIVARLTRILDGQKNVVRPADAGRYVGAPRAAKVQ